MKNTFQLVPSDLIQQGFLGAQMIGSFEAVVSRGKIRGEEVIQ